MLKSILIYCSIILLYKLTSFIAYVDMMDCIIRWISAHKISPKDDTRSENTECLKLGFVYLIII